MVCTNHCEFDLMHLVHCCLHFVLIERIKIQVESDGSGIVLRQNLMIPAGDSRKCRLIRVLRPGRTIVAHPWNTCNAMILIVLQTVFPATFRHDTAAQKERCKNQPLNLPQKYRSSAEP